LVTRRLLFPGVWQDSSEPGDRNLEKQQLSDVPAGGSGAVPLRHGRGVAGSDAGLQ